MKSNFKPSTTNDQTEQKTEQKTDQYTRTTTEQKVVKSIHKTDSNMSPEEFEAFVAKSGAVGSFMIFRSSKEDEELGIDEL